MATTVTPPGPPTTALAAVRPYTALRRVLLALHMATGVGWLGVTSTFVVLTLWLLGTREAATLRTGYAIHELMVDWLARPAAIGTATTGLLLVATAGRLRTSRWWVWWVPAKLALVVATVVVTVGVSPDALDRAVADATAAGTPAYTDTQHVLVLMAFYHVLMITAALLLTVFRPGRRFRRSRPAQETSTPEWSPTARPDRS